MLPSILRLERKRYPYSLADKSEQVQVEIKRELSLEPELDLVYFFAFVHPLQEE